MFQVNTGAILETYLHLCQIQTDQISFSRNYFAMLNLLSLLVSSLDRFFKEPQVFLWNTRLPPIIHFLKVYSTHS